MQLNLINRDPASAIAEFEQILASNSGEDAFDCAIKLFAAKVVDESNSREKPTQFAIHKTPEATHRAVQALYTQALQRWPHLNGVSSSLDISPQHLVRSMRPLIGWRLAESDLAWLDTTLERLVAKDAKGALGQYFTPRDIIRLCIEVLNPVSSDKVIDPACGSGGFLFEATRHAIAESGTAPACLGIDFGARAIKVAALLAAATPKARMTISKANSLDGRQYAEESPLEWRGFLMKHVGASTSRARSWGPWNRLGCTVVATNPPFAGSIDEPDILDAYESQQVGLGRNAVSREHLFLERSIQLLRPGGRLAIVLPQGLLANSSASYLRAWLFRTCRIIGAIGLHPHAFVPYTSVKTALLFAEKLAPGKAPSNDYPIFFASSRDCGKDSRGRATGTADYTQLTASFISFLQSQKTSWASRARNDSESDTVYETVPFSEVIKNDRLDAEYYDPAARSILRKFHTSAVGHVGNFVDPKQDRFKRQLFNEINYLDISSVDNKTGLTIPTPMASSEAPSRASYMVQPNDVLVSTVRPDRNVVALVMSAIGNRPMVASNGFCVLRPKGIEPEVLFAYCKTESFRTMLTRHATASMYPTVTDRDVLNIPLVPPPPEVADRVRKLVRDGLEMTEKAQALLRQAVALMNEQFEVAAPVPAAATEIRQERRSYRVKNRAR